MGGRREGEGEGGKGLMAAEKEQFRNFARAMWEFAFNARQRHLVLGMLKTRQRIVLTEESAILGLRASDIETVLQHLVLENVIRGQYVNSDVFEINFVNDENSLQIDALFNAWREAPSEPDNQKKGSSDAVHVAAYRNQKRYARPRRTTKLNKHRIKKDLPPVLVFFTALFTPIGILASYSASPVESLVYCLVYWICSLIAILRNHHPVFIYLLSIFHVPVATIIINTFYWDYPFPLTSGIHGLLWITVYLFFWSWSIVQLIIISLKFRKNPSFAPSFPFS
jgi:hypothetical protein